jgi:rubrerythrin
VARNEGFEQIAGIFQETVDYDREYAKSSSSTSRGKTSQ